MILIDDAEILRLARPADLIATLAQAFRKAAPPPPSAHFDLPGGDGAKLLLLPAWRDREAIGAKIITVMPANAAQGRPTIDGVYVLLDGATGAVRAVLGAAALTRVRTAAVSALAADRLARADARTLLMVGTGALAPHLIAAHGAIRRFEKIRIWGRDPAKAETVARAMQASGIAVEAVADLGAEIGRADIISTATAATLPLIAGDAVAPGTHLDLVGGFAPDMREADSALVRRGALVVDTGDALFRCGDLIAPIAEGVLVPDAIRTLHDLVRAPRATRAPEAITVFKSVGSGLSDIAVASRLLALKRGELAETPGTSDCPDPKSLPTLNIGGFAS